MKKTVLGGLFLSAVVSLPFVACTDGYGTGFGQSDGTGKISLRADLDANVVSKCTSRAEYNEVSASDLSIQMISADGAKLGPWTLSEFQNEERRFNIGYYTVEAFYGNSAEEGFEKPYFYGCAEQVKVQDNQTTSVSLVATIQNAAVSVRYTDSFRQYMSDWSARVKSIKMEASETRPVYVRPGEVTVDVEFVKPNGNGATMEVKRFTAEPAHYYTLTVDMASGSGVVEGIVVTIDEEVTEIDEPIDISDEVLNSPAPEVSASGFDPAEVFGFVGGQSINNTVGFNIIARGGLRSVNLSTESAQLISKGWPADVDLINPGGSRSVMEDLGLKALGVFQNPDKMAVVNLAGVFANINYSEGSSQHVFTLTVTDALGKTSEPMVLKAEAQQVVLQLSNPVLYLGSTTMTVDLTYNGGDPTGVIEIRKTTANGGSGVLLATTYEKIGTNLYRATCTGGSLATEETINIIARSKTDTSLSSQPLTVEPLPMLIVDSSRDIDAYAKSVVIPVTMGKDNSAIASSMSAAKVMLSSASRSGSFQVVEASADASGRTYRINSLQPATAYTVKIVSGDMESPEVSFTTEAATQITNGNLDSEAVVAGSASNWACYTYETWGTNNMMTTSQGSNYAYCRISGTIPTTDSHSGNAVLIRTVGWGSGNTATGSKGTSGTCKYTDSGLLHLGSNRSSRPVGYSANDNTSNGASAGPITTDDLDCGIAFASRPAELSFWYKYNPKNSADKGLCEVTVYDASGNVLSSGRVLLDSSSNYVRQTIGLSYTTATKAARLYVKFLSSYDMEYVKRSDANFSGPGFANVSNGTFMGSQLYIDDVELSY